MRRRKAVRLAGLEKIKAIVKDCDDDTAMLIVVDTNLGQRDEILPSEKAKAYKFKLEALNRHGQRTDLTSGQTEPKLRSDDLLAKMEGTSRANINRLIRLNELIPQLLDMIDNKAIAAYVGAELSFLSKEAQTDLYSILKENSGIKVSIGQAEAIREASNNGLLSLSQIEMLLGASKPEKEKAEQEPTKARLVKPAYKTALKSVERFLDKEPNYLIKLEKADAKEIERRVRMTIEKYFEEL